MKSTLRELHQIVKSESNDEFTVVAIPGAIQTDKGMVDAIQTTIFHNPTGKKVETIYRDNWSNYGRFLKENKDRLISALQKQILENINNK